jgi:hypothetical protein
MHVHDGLSLLVGEDRRLDGAERTGLQARRDVGLRSSSGAPDLAVPVGVAAGALLGASRWQGGGARHDGDDDLHAGDRDLHDGDRHLYAGVGDLHAPRRAPITIVTSTTAKAATCRTLVFIDMVSSPPASARTCE